MQGLFFCAKLGDGRSTEKQHFREVGGIAGKEISRKEVIKLLTSLGESNI